MASGAASMTGDTSEIERLTAAVRDLRDDFSKHQYEAIETRAAVQRLEVDVRGIRASMDALSADVARLVRAR